MLNLCTPVLHPKERKITFQTFEQNLCSQLLKETSVFLTSGLPPMFQLLGENCLSSSTSNHISSLSCKYISTLTSSVPQQREIPLYQHINPGPRQAYKQLCDKLQYSTTCQVPAQKDSLLPTSQLQEKQSHRDN